MHDFSNLANASKNFTLNALSELHITVNEELQSNASTSLIKTLQTIRLSKVIFAIGLFSIFESVLQSTLKVKNGFKGVKALLDKKNEYELLAKFINLELAINALKHGEGRSYHTLIAQSDKKLNSRIKQINESYLIEGDVSEVHGLVDVNDEFIEDIIELICKIELVITN